MGRLTAVRSPLQPASASGPAPVRRGSFRERGYTARWDPLSRQFKRANPLCLGCKAAGRVEATTVTDHIVPHRGNRRLLWDEANWQPSCDWHHNVVKQVLERQFEAGELADDDLRLDSAAAQAVAARLIAEGRGPRA